MEYMTISEVSKKFLISTRMLRHYEKLGMIESIHRDGYAYRIYDENAIKRLQQIIVLRKLQIPLKQIQIILDGDIKETILILANHIKDMDGNITSIQKIRNVSKRLLNQLQKNMKQDIYTHLVKDNTILEITNTLSLSKYQLKEKKNMNHLNEMVKKSEQVRIVLLPPFTVAAHQYIGENPEEATGGVIDNFIRSNKLYEKKPDSRLFGFNNPDPEEDSPIHGYENWLTIPEDMEVPEPLIKKHFKGGLYAAYAIKFPDFFEWAFLMEWVEKSERYQANYSDISEKNQRGCLEEYINWVYASHMGWPENCIDGKVDLLLPIKQISK